MMMAIDAFSPANGIAGTDLNGKFLRWLDNMEFSLSEIPILTTILRYNICFLYGASFDMSYYMVNLNQNL